MWICFNCREAIEPQFKTCWNCGSDEHGNADPQFVNDAEPEPPIKSSPSRLLGWAWMILAIASFVGLMAGAIYLDRLIPEWWNRRLSLILGLLIFCLVVAVAINVASRLYLWLRQYLYESESTSQKLVQLKDATHFNDKPT